MSTIKKVISVVLTVLMLVGVFSVATPVFAADVTEAIEQREYREKLLTEAVESNEEKAEIVCEVPEKRDEYSKTYKRADGSYTTVVSQTPIHSYKNGKWAEIDNTLNFSGEALKNATGIYEVEFPETISESEKITVTNGEEALAFSLNGIESSRAEVSENKTESADKISADLSKAISGVTYQNIGENTDIEYIVAPEYIKENIIVHSKESLNDTYSFEIEKGNLSVSQDAENNIVFKNEKNEIAFSIPAPVMKDAEGNASYDIAVRLSSPESTTLTLTYTPSKEWLNSSERVYPIAIDPVIQLPSSGENELIDDTVLLNDSTNAESKTTNYKSQIDAFISNTDSLKSEVLVKFNMNAFNGFKQPAIEVTDVNYIFLGYVLNGNILAKEVNGDWNCAEITYSDVYPEDSSEPALTYGNITDYFSGAEGDPENADIGTVNLNITELFRGWLSGEKANNGFAIVAEDSSVTAGVFLNGSTIINQSTLSLDTYCTIDYVDVTASADYEALTQEIGRAGTASVNAFARSLFLNRADLSLNGLRMPANISFNYTPALTNYLDAFSTIYSEALGEPIEMPMPYGNNWAPSYLQMLATIDDEQFQVFTAEGSVAVFNMKEETVTDEATGETSTNLIFEEDSSGASGYSIEFDSSANDYYLLTPNNEKVYFNSDGLACKIKEAEANADGAYDEITIVYSESNMMEIDYITDGTGRKYDFVYSTETGLLNEINCLTATNEQIKAGTTATDLKVTYSYDSNGNLVRVNYPDGKYVIYDYENGNLVKATNIDNYNIEYTYDSLGKVTIITEMADSTAGNFITLEDLSSRQVKITDAYLGTEIHQFGKDGKLNYIFDDKGNFYKSEYSQSGDETVSAEYGWKVEPENILKNGSFEEITNSQPDNWATPFDVVDTIDGTATDYACKVSGSTQQTQTISVNGATAYTFSLYAKSSFENAELDIQITAKNSDESSTNKSKKIYPTEDFEQYSVTVSPCNDVTEITVAIGGSETVGEISVDNAQLESGNGTAEFNFVENGSFNNTDENWSEATVVSESINGKSVNAVKLSGGLPSYNVGDGLDRPADSISAITQNVKINGKKGDIYSVGGWFKGLFDDNYVTSNFTAEDIELTPQLTNSSAQIKVTYSYTETIETTDEATNETTTSEETITENFVVDFAPHNNGWQYAVDSFALKADVESVDVTVMAKNIPADSYATNISLTKDSDAVLNEEDNAENEEETEEICSCGCEDCYYGENCPCSGAINNDCQCPECLRKETSTEDSFGNTLSNKSTNGIKYIETLSSYTEDGNYIATYTDERGNVTTYDYNTLNGILEAVTSPVGTESEASTTSYEYDEMGNVVSVSTTVSETQTQALQYVYSNDRLTEIITPNGKYKIIYDAWGQVLSVNLVVIKNGIETNIPLVQYTYGNAEKRTQIATATYSNSSTNKNIYQYSYFDNGNIKNIKLNQKDKHNITYDNLGSLTKIENVGGRTVEYVENGVNIFNASGTLVYTSIMGDDGLTTEENYGIKYKDREPEYNYDSATGSSTNTTALDIAKYYRVEQNSTTDWFGREEAHLTTIYDITEETETVSAETIGKISTEYEYPVADDGKTSSTIEKYVNKTYNGNSESVRVYDGYYYEYDKQNKISAEKTLNADGTTTDKYSYEYDKLGQLVRFNDAVENKSYTYTYDNNGNILTKSEYAYTTGDLGTATNTTTYGYDTQWKDKLTTVGDKAIAYDNIGNPTSYLGATLAWEGRNLKSYETEEQKLQYEYDENGMRYRTTITNKEDNSVGYLDYVWVDSKLISISFTSDELNQTVKYLYNDFDEPVGFVSTREDGSVDTYYYLKNAQGDITNIVSAAGKKMVSFTYDVFGKRTVEYQANGSTNPGQIELLTQMKADLLNPFAYRGYCYDYDMGMYYLQSRYYDPNTGRFINADDTNYLNATGTVLGCNLFAYCENDPVNNVDPRGNKKRSNNSFSLKSDWAGREILWQYLYGGGKTRIYDSKKWAEYMMDNYYLELYVKNYLLTNYINMKKNTSKKIDVKLKMVIDNGEDIIGYQYLHGTNSSVGGFKIKGTIKNNSKGKITFDLTYTWNDIIDPDLDYTTDQLKAVFAKAISFGKAKDYIIRIKWSDKSVFNQETRKWTKGWMKN